MSQRIQIVLPDPVAVELRDLANASGEPPSTLAAQMVRTQIAQAAEDGRIGTPTTSLRRLRPEAGERPRWLKPNGSSTSWHAEMWGAIIALHSRYPRALGALKDGWWDDDAHTETLCALATWRAEIDSNGQNPREDLAFHAQLADYGHALKAQSGGVTKIWQPGAPPDGWMSDPRR